MARKRPNAPPGWREVFLAELARWGILNWASEKAGVHRATVYKLCASDPAFALACEDAKAKALAQFEVVARQRALLGTEKPVFYRGKQIATVREIDNAHLRWVLSKMDPETYGDRVTVAGDKENPLQHEVTWNLENLSTHDLRELYRIQEAATKHGENGK